jgi:uncharacterized membrane protein YeaQ/YmgE (transglycosylase-associated protein family)
MPSINQIVVWIIIGLLGGSLAGLIITRERKGFGILSNLGVGALVGGLVFRLFGIFPGLDKIAMSLRDVVAALIGSLLVLALIWLWQRFQKSSAENAIQERIHPAVADFDRSFGNSVKPCAPPG